MTIFLQQFGRGLRKAEGKSHVTILDFVGHCRSEFNYSDRFRRLISRSSMSVVEEVEKDFPHLPLGCHITLERVAKEYILENVEQMRAWARDFAKKLTAPCVVALHGDLGMGTSEIARTVIQTLRGPDTVVPSPTFTIVQSYDGISHFDLYRVEDATELTDSDLDTIDEYEEDNFAEDSEVSDFADEDLKEPELHELQMDNDFEENDEEELEEEIDIPKDEEVIEEPESNDFIDSINEVEPTISETLTEDRLKYLEDLAGEEKEEEPAEEVENEIVEPEVEDTVMEEPATDEENTEDSEFEEPVVEENEEESQIEEPVEETAEIIEEEDEEAEQNEPTEDVFNSPQWDNEVPTVENVIAETEEEIEEVSEPVEEESNEVVETEIEQTIEEEPEVEDVTEEDVTEQQISQPEVSEAKTEVVSPTPSAQGATAKIQDDIKSVLVYMDQLLENLPEDKIEEFAKSEHFDTYKKLFNELGISN